VKWHEENTGRESNRERRRAEINRDSFKNPGTERRGAWEKNKVAIDALKGGKVLEVPTSDERTAESGTQ